MKYHMIPLCGGKSMMLSPSERFDIDLMAVSASFDDVLRVSKDMMEFMFRDVKITLYPNGSVMFYHFTDLDVARSYADEVIGMAVHGRDEIK